MPAHRPPHKSAPLDPGAAHRLRMCHLLLGGAERLAVCELELTRGGPSYTVDSLSAIHASHPDVELTLIVGADAASSLPDWRDAPKLLALAGVAVAARAGTDRRELLDRLAPLTAAVRSGASGRDHAVRFLEAPLTDVSSSLARKRIARGEAVEDLVGPAVAAYIAEHRLYRAPAADRRG